PPPQPPPTPLTAPPRAPRPRARRARRPGPAADIVVGKAASTLEKRVAVIGCGVIGLTTALTAQRAGMDVTIYTKDLLPHTRSVRANGSWTPDSRIALTKPAGPGFASLWEQMARYSWKTYRDYLGLPGNPIDFRDSYTLSDT
ncbi:FAD-dependent oxidoreductase, partial [Acetobacter orientalis]|uniref:FAD-dependent oxidoreductase n=1 Tax=Acetobacter orientalis TaxID=146474 RepID=UPI0039E78CEE